MRLKRNRAAWLSAKRRRDKNIHWLRTAKAKRLFSLCRWLHIYISCALFGLLLFFCITGITLNHPQWTGKSQQKVHHFELPSQLATSQDITKIQHFVEQQTGFIAPRNIDAALDIGEITFDYPLPGSYAFVTVLIAEQLVEVEQGNSGFIALLNDLHKGRHSGESWSWLLDISALLMALFSCTGVVIVLQNAKHRTQALTTLFLGTLSPVFIYFIAVPHF